jgi:1-acyl-sn-glycerol-3-phosphate acyltransferase
MSQLRKTISRLLASAEDRCIDELKVADAGHGYDAFGAHAQWVKLGLELTRFLHDHYFRVSASGCENIPGSGPTIVVANHSGTLPYDAAMLWANLLRVTEPIRLPRPIAEYFVPKLPFVSTLFARVGVVGGSRDNARTLLEMGEMLMIFPEGVAGIGKPFRERYHLARWNWGHAELALRYRAKIVPAAIIGAEEQMPQIARIYGTKRLGIPYLPIPATPLPLPVHYHIHYGEAIDLCATHDPADADRPEIVQAAAAQVKRAVQDLIDHGLQTRRGIFR